MDASFVIRLIDQVSGPGAKVKQALGGIKDGISGLKEGMGNALRKGLTESNIDEALKRNEAKLARARSRLTTALGTGLALAAPIKLAADFEDSFADLEKVLDVGKSRLENFRAGLLSSTALIPMKAKAMTDIMAEAAQGGVPVDELERFTDFTAKAAVAFDMAAGEIGERFAKLRNVFKLNQAGIEEMADAANHLSNNMAAKASEITNFTNRAAGAATTLKLTVTEMEAVGAAMIAAGIVPETAARGFSALSNKLAQGTPKVRKALKSVGIDYKTFMKSLDEDSTKALVELFEKLSSDDDGMTALIDLVGSDFSDDFAKLMNNPTILAEAFKLVADKAKYSGSAVGEFEKRSKTTLNQFELLKNKITRAGINIGTALLPPLNEVMTVVGNIAQGFADWTIANPELAEFATSAGGLALALTTALIAGDYLIALIRGPMIRALGMFVKFNEAGENVSAFAKLARGAKRKLRPLVTTLGNLLDKMGPIGRAGRRAGRGIGALVSKLLTLKGLTFAAVAVGLGVALNEMSDHHRVAEEAVQHHLETYNKLKEAIAGAAAETENLSSSMKDAAVLDAQTKIDEFIKRRNKVDAEIFRWGHHSKGWYGPGVLGGSDIAWLPDDKKAEFQKIFQDHRWNNRSTEHLIGQLSKFAQTVPSARAEIDKYVDDLIKLQAIEIDLAEQQKRLNELQSEASTAEDKANNGGNGMPLPRRQPSPQTEKVTPPGGAPASTEEPVQQKAAVAPVSGSAASNGVLGIDHTALKQIVSEGLKGEGLKDQEVKATIAAEVIDKRPPQLNISVSAPISITGVVDPVKAGNAAAQKLGSAVAKAKQGALHGGTE